MFHSILLLSVKNNFFFYKTNLIDVALFGQEMTAYKKRNNASMQPQQPAPQALPVPENEEMDDDEDEVEEDEDE